MTGGFAGTGLVHVVRRGRAGADCAARGVHDTPTIFRVNRGWFGDCVDCGALVCDQAGVYLCLGHRLFGLHQGDVETTVTCAHCRLPFCPPCLALHSARTLCSWAVAPFGRPAGT